jgi:membrane peptidoglycan carboxypeptidase
MAAIAALAVIGLAAIAVWLVVRDEVAELRSMSVAAGPVPRSIVTAAVLAAEDPGFLERRPLLPDFQCLRNDVRCCGGSTIAYQLIKSLDRPPRRMLMFQLETVLATAVVSQLYTPEQLLATYLNSVYLGTIDGRQVLGVEAAARANFGKPAAQLSLAEAAVIAGMIRSPNVYSPVKHPDRALDRRNKVLQRMLDQRLISEADYRHAVAERIGH